MVSLLGNGDPMVAFSRLQARILETLELGDDTIAMQAAAYSLGLASSGKTHLDRLVKFGDEYGYEARQARRYSDRGIVQLAKLICSNWVVHAVPSVEVFIAQQSDGSYAMTLRTKRQRLVDMQTVLIRRRSQDGGLLPLTSEPVFERVPPSADADRLWITERLQRPMRLPAPMVNQAGVLVRIEWHGEVWPRFSVSLVGSLSAEIVLTTQSLGNALQVELDRLTPALSDEGPAV